MTAYHYYDEDANLLFDVLRTPAKQFSMRRPNPDKPGAYIKNVKDVRRVLYRLPQIAHAPADEPIFVVEGEKDADRVAAHGFAATTNPGGPGKWRDEYNEYLKDRAVVIIPDNDEEGRRHAELVAKKLKGVARSIKILQLAGLAEGEDVSNWFDKGGTPEQLRSILADAPLYQALNRNQPYVEQDGRLIWNKTNGQQTSVIPLTNFTAKIVGDITLSDGATIQRHLEIEAKVHAEKSVFQIPASQFNSLNWVLEHLGPTAIIYPGQGIKDHTRVAIQTISHPAKRHMYSHVGWAKVNGSWYYLHADGAIGPIGTVGPASETLMPISASDLILPAALKRFRLPSPPQGSALRDAVRASLRFLKTANDRITISILSAVYTAVLLEVDFSIFLHGPTGAGKTAVAAAGQQHYGPEMDALHLPAQWSGTANGLEILAFHTKDALIVVDDFVPTGTPTDVLRQNATADRLLRGQANQGGRLRSNSEGTLQAAKHPRGLILSTGEELPTGQSLRARTLSIQVGREDVDFGRLSDVQTDAADGKYASALAAFIQHVANSYDDIRRRVRARAQQLRSEFIGQHRRTAPLLSTLAAALEEFLSFAETHGAITHEEREQIWNEALAAYGALAREQNTQIQSNEPTERFLSLLRAAIASGKAHIAAASGNEPSNPPAWGWILVEIFWRSRGQRIGWLDGDDLFINPDVAYSIATGMAGNSRDGLLISLETLKRSLREKKLLKTTDEKRERLTIRRTLEGARREVLHLAAGTLIEVAQPSQPDHVPEALDWLKEPILKGNDTAGEVTVGATQPSMNSLLGDAPRDHNKPEVIQEPETQSTLKTIALSDLGKGLYAEIVEIDPTVDAFH
jgi:Domain of unknown function (DUF927)